MQGMVEQSDTNRARRLELILQQVESLPTLPAVALRLLQLTNDESSDIDEIVSLIRQDQALTARVLSLCRRTNVATTKAVTTVDRAVTLLGLKVVRNAVLSIKVFQVFAEDLDPTNRSVTEAAEFSRLGFWRHSLAVGIAAELIAKAHPQIAGMDSSEAFVAGLVHDLGKLAIDHLLPKSYQRVVELAERHQLDIADVERRVIGLDHHTVGKRLAEHWRLPHVLQDCIWLHGTPWASLPELPHRRMVALISLADLLVRRQHIGYSGNFDLSDSLADRARDAGFDVQRVAELAEQVHTQLEERSQVMGIGAAPTRQVFLESIMHANEALGRLNDRLEKRNATLADQSRILQAVCDFHQHSTEPGVSVTEILDAIADSAHAVLGTGYLALLSQSGGNEPWLFSQYPQIEGDVVRYHIEPPAAMIRLSEWQAGQMGGTELMNVFPWLEQHLPEQVKSRELHALALPCGWGTAGILLHNCGKALESLPLQAMIHTWGAGLAASSQHQGARRLGEQLVDANRMLVDAQKTAARNQSLARVGEVAAGAAHEMNNPLAVIGGRAQLLLSELPENSAEHKAAEQIWKQAERLSNLISALRMFADPPEPKLQEADLPQVVEQAIEMAGERVKISTQPIVSGLEQLPTIQTDPDQLSQVFAELIVNAVEANSRSAVEIDATVDAINNRLVVRVKDDGVGMDASVMEHAFDPFFSAKQAGRQAGLGLSRARRFVEGLGGEVRLMSRPDRGTTVTVFLPFGS